MEIKGEASDLQQLLLFAILTIISQVFLLFVLSWNAVVIFICIILDVLLSVTGFADLLYFSRKITMDADGCTFASIMLTKKFTWEELCVQRTRNASFCFGDSEIPGEGVIISANIISKPKHIGAMTYCRLTHPATSVFVRFRPDDGSTKIYGKMIYRGFLADKAELLAFLRSCKTIS